jgi:hypothetical protein
MLLMTNFNLKTKREKTALGISLIIMASHALIARTPPNTSTWILANARAVKEASNTTPSNEIVSI